MAEAGENAPPVVYEPPPALPAQPPGTLRTDNFPFDPAAARKRVKEESEDGAKVVDLGRGISLLLRRIPAGTFIMGAQDGYDDECPRAVTRIERSFWMAETETTNAQYGRFDPDHDTRYIDMHFMDRVTPGYIANHPDQPVARVSWREAMAFCDWLSHKTGLNMTLPTEAQWEWAARAGSDTRFFYGSMATDFGPYANLADQSLRWFRMGFPGAGKLQTRSPYPVNMNFPLHDERFRDKYHVVDYVGQYEPNAWSLKDMIGNVSEWTRSAYLAYPYTDTDGRNDTERPGLRVVRGGS